MADSLCCIAEITEHCKAMILQLIIIKKKDFRNSHGGETLEEFFLLSIPKEEDRV